MADDLPISLGIRVRSKELLTKLLVVVTRHVPGVPTHPQTTVRRELSSECSVTVTDSEAGYVQNPCVHCEAED
jgi:hypothetical protein